MRIAIHATDGVPMFHVSVPLMVFGEVRRQGLADLSDAGHHDLRWDGLLDQMAMADVTALTSRTRHPTPSIAEPADALY